jgi:hypothetical protein
MDYTRCSQGVKKGETVTARLLFGLGIARYKLSLWQKNGDNWVCCKTLETDGNSEDARKDQFDVVVDWTGDRLFYFPAHVTYPADKASVFTTIEIWSGDRMLGSSSIKGEISSGGELPITNGIILQGTQP